MNNRLLVFFTLAGGSISGCSPVATVERYGIEATLVDAGNEKPITRSPATITIDQRTFHETTNKSGSVRLPPDRELKLSWLGGPIVADNLQAMIEVACPGFAAKRFVWYRAPNANEGKQAEDFPAERGVIKLGVIRLDEN